MGISQNIRIDYIKQYNLKKFEVILRDVTETFRIVKNRTRLPRFKYKCYICFETFISHSDLVSHKTRFKNKACQKFTKVKLKTSKLPKHKQVGKSAYTCNDNVTTNSSVGIKNAPAKPFFNNVPSKPLVSFDKVARLKTSSNTNQQQVLKSAPTKSLVGIKNAPAKPFFNKVPSKPLVSFDRVAMLKTSSNTNQKQIPKSVPTKSLVGIKNAPAKRFFNKVPSKPLVSFDKVAMLKTSSNTNQKQIPKSAPIKYRLVGIRNAPAKHKVPTTLKTNAKEKQVGQSAPTKSLVPFEKVPTKPLVTYDKDPTEPLTIKKLCVQPKLRPSKVRKRHKTPELSAVNYAFVNANEEMDIPHYKCLRCEQLFISKSALFSHVQKSKCNINNCDVCTGTFTKNSEFYEHYIADHTDRAICNFCFRTFKCERNLKEHMLRHLNLFRVRCQNCDKGFYRVRDYMNHYKSRHMGIKHKCKICGRCFADEYYFRTHITSHAGANSIAVLQISPISQ